MAGSPDTSEQDALIAEQRASLAELKRKEQAEKKKASENQAKQMRRQLGGSLAQANDKASTLGGA